MSHFIISVTLKRRRDKKVFSFWFAKYFKKTSKFLQFVKTDIFLVALNEVKFIALIQLHLRKYCFKGVGDSHDWIIVGNNFQFMNMHGIIEK